MSSGRPRLVIVTPALSDANNGNWQTARRWAGFLADDFDVSVQLAWDGSPADAMIALHARRSAGSIEAWARARARADSKARAPEGDCLPVPGLAVVLTGTDLYRDIESDPSAQRSLALAQALVVLNERGADALPPAVRAKARCVLQSAPALAPLPPRPGRFDLAMVGHLRDEKDPLTAVRALARLPDADLRLRHAGGVRDERLGEAMRAAAAADPRIELEGDLPHAQARDLIRASRLLVLPSRMEGGANVLIEAITGGVPVLASRIDGSVGLLGEDYPGYFPIGDDVALAALITRCRAEPAFVERLRTACEARAARFSPEHEQQRVRGLARDLVARDPSVRQLPTPAPASSPGPPAAVR